jgi:hypothetical protein
MSKESASIRAARRAIAALAALLAGVSHAAPRPLNDAEMSAVRGADGSILAGLSTAPSASSGNGLAQGLRGAFASGTGSTLLTADQFAATLASLGLSTAAMPAWDGQPVLQTRVDAAPTSFSFNFSDVLGTLGVSYAGAASMGTFTLNGFDARGTTVWVWPHH